MKNCFNCKNKKTCVVAPLQVIGCESFSMRKGGRRPNSGAPKKEKMDRFQVTLLQSVVDKIGRARLRVLLIEAAEVELKRV